MILKYCKGLQIELDQQKQSCLKSGIIEMSKESAGFTLLQQVRDESHRFAIKNNRKKKNKSIKRLCPLDNS